MPMTRASSRMAAQSWRVAATQVRWAMASMPHSWRRQLDNAERPFARAAAGPIGHRDVSWLEALQLGNGVAEESFLGRIIFGREEFERNGCLRPSIHLRDTHADLPP